MNQNMPPHNKNTRGFTLIEVIIAIILAALLGTMIIQYTGTNLTATVKALVGTQNNTTAVRVMEQITRDYRNWLEDHPNQNLSAFRSNINNNYPEADTQFVEVSPGSSQFVEVPPGQSNTLRITVTQGDRKLVSLFTK